MIWTAVLASPAILAMGAALYGGWPLWFAGQPPMGDAGAEVPAIADMADNAAASEPDAVVERPALDHVVTARRGDTLIDILTRAGVHRREAHEVASALRPVYDPRKLGAGDMVTLTFTDGTDPKAAGELVILRLDAAYDREAGVRRGADGSFAAFAVDKAIDFRLARTSGTIRSSLYADGVAAGVPAKVMAAMIRLFSYDVDFQRDLQPGDRFDILFERHFAADETPVRDGEIVYAALTLGGNPIGLYRYDGPGGDLDYYTRSGDSVRKTLLRTPIDGARLSSGFGMRAHPILGFSVMHKGVDFAAPAGTPIYAAGDGVVEVAGSQGTYGNIVRIRHANGVATAYGHMNSFARGLQRGLAVKQGQVIGTVGTTGRSTGPHLHYEVLKAGHQVNPLSVQMQAGRKLMGRERDRFRAQCHDLDRLLQDLPARINVALGR